MFHHNSFMATLRQPFGKTRGTYLQLLDNIEATSGYPKGNLVTTSCQPCCNVVATLATLTTSGQLIGNFL